MTPEQQHLLYADETGELADVYEVQLLGDELGEERAEPLRRLLHDENPQVRFDSMQVLVAWGDPVALQHLVDQLQTNHPDLVGADSHRLHGTDTTLDRLGHALAMAVSVAGSDSEYLYPIADLMLDGARTGFVENGLERFLSKLGHVQLAPKLISVIHAKLDQGNAREASDLLPALAHLDPASAQDVVSRLRADGYDSASAMGVARTLAIFGTPEAQRELQALRDRKDLPGAAGVAERELKQWRE